MKNPEMIALGLAAIAVYLIATAKPKTAVNAADGPIFIPLQSGYTTAPDYSSQYARRQGFVR